MICKVARKIIGAESAGWAVVKWLTLLTAHLRGQAGGGVMCGIDQSREARATMLKVKRDDAAAG
jgi:hypothetical protein